MTLSRKLLLLIAPVLFFSCSDDNSSEPQKAQPLNDGGPYTETRVTINRDGVKTESAVLRFYSATGDVPYVSICDFHRIMVPFGSMSISRQGDYYQISNSGGTATIDVRNDQLTTSQFLSIFDMTYLHGCEVPGASNDNSLYIKPVEMQFQPSAASITFDFGKYNIDLFDDGTDVYVPYATLADIYSDMYMDCTYYNDTDSQLVVINHADFFNYYKHDPKHTARLAKRLQISDQLAQYRYNELCFVFDNIYGYPGRAGYLYDAGMEECGLDAALDKVRTGSSVKKLLKSADNGAFILGMEGLNQLIYDGGHTGTSLADIIQDDSPLQTSYDNHCAQNPDIIELKNIFLKSMYSQIDYYISLQKAREESYGDRKYIVSSDGSTAVIVLNSFMELDYEGWNQYYSSARTDADWQTLLARDSNAVATFLSGVQQARADGVRNVILDVSLNTGGSSDIPQTIHSLITNNPAKRQYIPLIADLVLSGQTYETDYVVDRNFDGRFDTSDLLVDYSDLNFLVLTSNITFSAANFIASQLKDEGIKIMGLQSGGGSCAIQFQFTPDAFKYQISTFRCRIRNANYENIDNGIPVDIPVPFDQLYDIDYLSSLLSE